MKVTIYGIVFEGKVIYVGQSTSPRLRFLKHQSNARLGSKIVPKLYDHMRQYDPSGYSHVDLEICDADEASQKESEWIKRYDTVKSGLNVHSHQRYTREKKQPKEFDYGAKEIVNSAGQSFETISAACRVMPSEFESARDNIRRALKTGIQAFGVYWRYADKEFIRLSPLSTGRKGNRRNVKPVICKKSGREWSCLKDVSDELNIPYVTLQKWVTKGRSDNATKYLEYDFAFK